MDSVFANKLLELMNEIENKQYQYAYMWIELRNIAEAARFTWEVVGIPTEHSITNSRGEVIMEIYDTEKEAKESVLRKRRNETANKGTESWLFYYRKKVN